MSNCVMIGRCVGVRNYRKKDGNPGCSLSVADQKGTIFQFFGSIELPDFPFGTPVSVDFDMSMFNGKVSSLIVDNVQVVHVDKKEGK